MLSERPNVRVHGDPAIMCPAKEPFRARNAGVPFLEGTPSLGTQRTGTEKVFKKSICSLSQPIWADSYSPLLGQRAQRSRLEALTQRTKERSGQA